MDWACYESRVFGSGSCAVLTPSPHHSPRPKHTQTGCTLLHVTLILSSLIYRHNVLTCQWKYFVLWKFWLNRWNLVLSILEFLSAQLFWKFYQQTMRLIYWYHWTFIWSRDVTGCRSDTYIFNSKQTLCAFHRSRLRTSSSILDT